MTTSDHNDPNSDVEVDALLRSYFQSEIPAELPPLPRRVSPPTPSVRQGRSAIFGSTALLAVAASLLLMLAILQPTSTRAPVPEPPMAPADRQAIAKANETHVVRNGLEYCFMERPGAVDTKLYTIANGAIEQQRTAVRWQVVSIYEPETGDRIELSSPELTISVALEPKPAAP